MDKLKISQHDVQSLIARIGRTILVNAWKPDYIVGIVRGGLVPALYLSHYLNVPMHTLNVSLRDNEEGESNLWMAEDALGPNSRNRIVDDENDIAGILSAASDLLENGGTYKNILIVDDINDQGCAGR